MTTQLHIVYSDVKLSGSSPKHAYISVLFHTVEEIESLIEMLTVLKEASSELPHCHLQNYDYRDAHKKGVEVEGTEVFFYSPGVLSNDFEMELRDKLVNEYQSACHVHKQNTSETPKAE